MMTLSSSQKYQWLTLLCGVFSLRLLQIAHEQVFAAGAPCVRVPGGSRPGAYGDAEEHVCRPTPQQDRHFVER